MSDILRLWVIFRHPVDYPNHWVVGRQDVGGGGGVVFGPKTRHATLEEARAAIPEGLVNMGRNPEDVPSIYEVWI